METKGRRLPRGIHRTDDGRFRLYVTRRGRPVRQIVTWECLQSLQVPVPQTRLGHPGLDLARAALVKLQARLLDEQRMGAIAASTKVKIGSLLELMEQDFLLEGKKSWSHVQGRWKQHLKRFFADIYASELTTDSIKRYILLRQRRGVAGTTINRELSVIERMMHLGERTTPPLVRGVPHFPKFKDAPARTGFLEQAEYDILRQHATELWLRALLAAYYTHGFRKSELLHLLVRQVSLLDGTINLPAGGTKNGMARCVAMTSEVRTLVAALIHGKKPDDHVFTRANGEPVRDFRAAWRNLFVAAGLEPRRLHDMRRGAVRNAIRRHVDRDTVKKMSGHLTDDVFSRYNIQATDDMRNAARLIEDIANRAVQGRTDHDTDTKTDTRAVAERRPQ